MKKTCGIAELRSIEYHAKAAGGIFVQFEGGVRNAVLMGWIEKLTLNGDVVAISLFPTPIERGKTGWVPANNDEVIINIASPIEQLILADGGERHFNPANGGRHFSVYHRDALIRNSNSDLYDLGEYASMLTKDAHLITRM
jgi:hypothetical protein